MFGKQTRVEESAAPAGNAAQAATPGKTTMVQQLGATSAQSGATNAQPGASSTQAGAPSGPASGNRPEPSASSDPRYVLHSTGSRVLQVGDPAEYRIDQAQPVAPAEGSHVGIRWQVISDPAAVQAGRVPATIAGPVDQRTWGQIFARVPGMHTVKAWVSSDGQQVAEPTYGQQVVDAAHSPVWVPDSAAAAPLATIQDFIALVRRVEGAYGGRPWQDVVTRLRKELYPGPGLRQQLLEPFTWNQLIPEQQNMPGIEVPPVAMADLAAIRRNAVVSGPAGDMIDIGHILTGVDSFNFPQVGGTFARHGMDGPSAATWAGDVGSALVYWAVDGHDASDRTKQEFYDDFANPSDMLGDVDALAIAHGPNLNLPPSAPLSQRLEAFYQAPTPGRDQRFHSFCRGAQLNVVNHQLDGAAAVRIRDQILRFARGFNVKGKVLDAVVRGNGGYPGPQPELEDNTSVAKIEREATWFANHFLSWVNGGLASESV